MKKIKIKKVSSEYKFTTERSGGDTIHIVGKRIAYSLDGRRKLEPFLIEHFGKENVSESEMIRFIKNLPLDEIQEIDPKKYRF